MSRYKKGHGKGFYSNDPINPSLSSYRGMGSMVDHISMMLAIGGIGLWVLGFAFGILVERKRKVGPLVDRLWELEKKSRG